MADTVVELSGEQHRRFLQGYDGSHRPVEARNLDGALAGGGAILSTAGDMLKYVDANLHPEKYAPLSGALALSHQLRDHGNGGQQIALAWAYAADSGTYWHNGGTAGFTSHAFFDPRADYAAVVLLNSGPNTLLTPDAIAEHIEERLSGQPAVSLVTVLVPASRGFPGVLRSFGAYWFTMLAAGIFIYGAVLGTQGLAAQVLPRRLFLRVSGYLQLAAIAVIIGVYFLQPGFSGLDDLAFNSIWRLIQWLPSYWFLGLYEQLNGTMHPALAPLARRAWIGLAVVVCGTAVVYTLSYWRTLRKIVEEPDILPGSHRLSWLPRFGSQPQTAIGQFSVRTMARSKQHRLILGFYLGIGLAITGLMLKGSPGAQSNPWREESMLLWAASNLLVVLAAMGTRAAFALPLDLRANWIFRVIGTRAGVPDSGCQPACAAAARGGAGVARDGGGVPGIMAFAAERGAPGSARAPWRHRNRTLPVAFPENSLYLFIPARQVPLSHGFSSRIWHAVARFRGRHPGTARVAGDQRHGGDAGAARGRLGRGPADDGSTSQERGTGTAF